MRTHESVRPFSWDWETWEKDFANGEFWVEGVDDSDEEDGDVPPEMLGEECVRIRAPKVEESIVKKLRDPKLPSQKDVDEHWLSGHLPYRDWCHICIEARGKKRAHKKDEGKQRDLPEYSWDFCFPVSYTHLTLPTKA